MSYSKYNSQGTTVLNTFKRYFKTSLSTAELAKQVSSSPDIIGQLGFYYVTALDTDVDRLESAMSELASRSSKIPDSISFYNAMKAEMDSNFFYIVKYASAAAAGDIADTVSTYASLSKFLVQAGPILILGGLGVWAYKKLK